MNTLKNKIQMLAQNEALGHYLCDVEGKTYDGALEADNIHQYGDVLEPFEGYRSDEVKENLETEASVLETFAYTVISAMSVEDLLEEIRKRAKEQGVAEYTSDVNLLLLKQMDASQKDELVNRQGWRYLSECDEVLTCLDDVGEHPFTEASSFGISYVNGY